MTLQAPPPPPISPRQMTLLRVVSAMAWADGELADDEMTVMLEGLSQVFVTDTDQRAQLQEQLREYLVQKIPLEELIPKLEDRLERELVLKLGYEVIACSARSPEEANINPEEAAAYQQLLQLLNLPPETVARLEAEAQTDLAQSSGVIDALSRGLETFAHDS